MLYKNGVLSTLVSIQTGPYIAPKSFFKFPHSCSLCFFSEFLFLIDHQNTNMLVYSIFELFTQAASSSGFIFCFCNLIIVIILMDLKPRLSFNEGSEIPLSMDRRSQGKTQTAGENSKGVIAQKEEEEAREMQQEQKKEEEASANSSNEEDLVVEVEEEIPEKEDDDDDEELRRRVEEFIEKVNKAWKAESFST